MSISLLCGKRRIIMKFGSFTFQPQKPQGFDFHVLRLKLETGIRLTPVPDMISNIAVFADNVAVTESSRLDFSVSAGSSQDGKRKF